MKKIILSIIAGILVLSFVSCNGNIFHITTDTEVDETTVNETNETKADTDSNDECEVPVYKSIYCQSLEEYYQALNDTPPREEDFVHFEDIAFLGEFSSFRAEQYSKDDYPYLKYCYTFKKTNISYEINIAHKYGNNGEEYNSFFTHDGYGGSHIERIEPSTDYLGACMGSGIDTEAKYIVSGKYCDIEYYLYEKYEDRQGDLELFYILFTYGDTQMLIVVTESNEILLADANDTGNVNFNKLLSSSTADEVVSQIIENVEQ